MQKLIYLLGITFFLSSCTGQNMAKPVNTETYKTLEASDSVLVIDVRTPSEVAEGYIDGTDYFYNINDGDFQEKITALDKEKVYLVYCRSGKRSSSAINQMDKLGFKHLYELKGGILSWEDPNYIKK